MPVATMMILKAVCGAMPTGQRKWPRSSYYAVPLTRYGILAEMTATNRVGFHRYTFPATDSAAIVIDLQNGGCWDKATDTEMMPMSDRMIAGHRFSTGWSDDQKVYFAAEFSEPFDEFTLHGFENRFGRVSFAPMKEGAQVTVRVGISPTSVEAAIANLRVETEGRTSTAWRPKPTASGTGSLRV